MKLFFYAMIAFLSVTLCQAAEASKWVCLSKSFLTGGRNVGGNYYSERIRFSNLHPLIGGSGDFNCAEVDENNLETGRKLSIEMVNFGPGAKKTRAFEPNHPALQNLKGLKLRCNTDDPRGTYFSMGASCAIGLGCELRAAIGSKGKLCSFTGIVEGGGADISIGGLEVKDFEVER